MLAHRLSEDLIPEDAPLCGRILCVDDEPQILSSLKRLLRRSGHTISLANNGQEALAHLEQNEVDIIISDMRMPEMDGNELLREIASRWPDSIRMLLTGYSDPESTAGAVNQGSIFRYINKPWDDTDLLSSIQSGLETLQLKQEQTRLLALIQTQNLQLQQLNQTLHYKAQDRSKEFAEVERRLQQTELESRKIRTNCLTILSAFTRLRFEQQGLYDEQFIEVVDDIAIRLNLDPAQQKSLSYATLIRNVGTLGLPDIHWHTPPEALTLQQWAERQSHWDSALELINQFAGMDEAVQISTEYQRLYANQEPQDNSDAEASREDLHILASATVVYAIKIYDDARSGIQGQNSLSHSDAIARLQHLENQYIEPETMQICIDILNQLDQ